MPEHTGEGEIVEAGQIAFITDDMAARELRRVANAIRDLEARLPGLARTLDEIAEKLWPSDRRDR